jgi:ankyrin repeat protein
MDVDAIASRIKAGVSTDAADSRGYTILHWLAWQTDGDSDVDSDRLRDAMLLLLNAGASVHAQTIHGDTPLHFATDGDGPNLTAVRLLLRFGASPNAANADARTPLHGAVEQSSLACTQALLAAGAEWGVLDTSGVSPADLARSTAERLAICASNPPDLEQYLGPLPESRKLEIAQLMHHSLSNAREVLALAPRA